MWLLLVLLAIPSCWATCNSSIHLECQFGGNECVPLEWRCDNMPDCSNGADESHCAYLHECPSGSMLCRDGECIEARFKCDGQVDCADETDERGCDDVIRGNQGHKESAVGKECSLNEYECSGGQCIVGSARCDGNWDCPNGEDEDDCSPEPAGSTTEHEPPPFADKEVRCREGTRKCADGSACIPSTWVCDGFADCRDSSDEVNCDHEEEPEDAAELMLSSDELCPAGTYQCQGGKCIDRLLACNGVRDCEHGDDEEGNCDGCKDALCEHECVNTPDGPRCICPEQHVLNHDGHSCDKEDECQTEGRRCSQFCENTLNGYECTCATNYALSIDKHTCHVDGRANQEGVLFVSLGSEIRTMPLFAPQMSSRGYWTFQSLSSVGTVRSISFDVHTNNLFLAVPGVHIDGRLAMSSGGTLRFVREDVAGINDVAVDWISGNVYYTAKYPSSSPGIYVCTQKGIFCKQLVKGQPNDPKDPQKKQSYKGLALHPLRGIMAWVDSYDGHYRIMIANMDGTNVRTLVESKLDTPAGLTFDHIKHDLYFGDAERELIEKINIDSRERSVVFSSGVHHPCDIAFFNGFLYWTDWGTETLKVASLGTFHTSPHLIHSFRSFPFGIAINHTMYQPSSESSPCANMNCPWICVSVPSLDSDELEGRCLCPQEYDEDATESSQGCEFRVRPTDVREHSKMGVSLMLEYCNTEPDICKNGGYCEEFGDADGVIKRVQCRCPEGYSGLLCEVENDAYRSYEGDEEEWAQAGQSGWKPLLACVVLVALICCGLYYASKNTNSLSALRSSTIDRLPDVRIPFAATFKGAFGQTTNVPPAEYKSAPADTPAPAASLVRSGSSNMCDVPPTYSNPLFINTDEDAPPNVVVQSGKGDL